MSAKMTREEYLHKCKLYKIKKRNRQVKRMEREVESLLSEYFRTYDKTEKEVNDRINLLYKKNLRSVRYTGTPESRKEINELVSRWDFISATLYGHYPKEVEDDMFCSHQEGLDIKERYGMGFYVFQYIEKGDLVSEAYSPYDKCCGRIYKSLRIDIYRKNCFLNRKNCVTI